MVFASIGRPSSTCATVPAPKSGSFGSHGRLSCRSPDDRIERPRTRSERGHDDEHHQHMIRRPVHLEGAAPRQPVRRYTLWYSVLGRAQKSALFDRWTKPRESPAASRMALPIAPSHVLRERHGTGV